MSVLEGAVQQLIIYNNYLAGKYHMLNLETYFDVNHCLAPADFGVVALLLWLRGGSVISLVPRNWLWRVDPHHCLDNTFSSSNLSFICLIKTNGHTCGQKYPKLLSQ